jgi:hypothetical protein
MKVHTSLSLLSTMQLKSTYRNGNTDLLILDPNTTLFRFPCKNDSFYKLMCGTTHMNIVMTMGYSCKNTGSSKNLSQLQHFHILTNIWDWAHHNRQEDGIKIQLMSSFSNSCESDHYITFKVTDFVEVNKQNKSLMQKYLNSCIYTYWSLMNGTRIKFQLYLKLWKIKL